MKIKKDIQQKEERAKRLGKKLGYEERNIEAAADLILNKLELTIDTKKIVEEDLKKSLAATSNTEFTQGILSLLGPEISNKILRENIQKLIKYLQKFGINYARFLFYLTTYYGAIKLLIKEKPIFDTTLSQLYSYIKRNLEKFVSLSDYHYEKFMECLLTGKPFLYHLEALIKQYSSMFESLKEFNKKFILAYPAYYAILAAIKEHLEKLSETLSELVLIREEIRSILKQIKLFRMLTGPREIAISPYFGPLEIFFSAKNKLRSEIEEGLRYGPFYIYFKAIEWFPQMLACLAPFLVIAGFPLPSQLIPEKIRDFILTTKNGIEQAKKICNQIGDLSFFDEVFLYANIIIIKHPYLFDYRINHYILLLEELIRKASFISASSLRKDWPYIISGLFAVLALLEMAFKQENREEIMKALDSCYNDFKDFLKNNYGIDLEKDSQEEMERKIEQAKIGPEYSSFAQAYIDKGSQTTYLSYKVAALTNAAIVEEEARKENFKRLASNPLTKKSFENLINYYQNELTILEENDKILGV